MAQQEVKSNTHLSAHLRPEKYTRPSSKLWTTSPLYWNVTAHTWEIIFAAQIIYAAQNFLCVIESEREENEVSFFLKIKRIIFKLEKIIKN